MKTNSHFSTAATAQGARIALACAAAVLASPLPAQNAAPAPAATPALGAPSAPPTIPGTGAAGFAEAAPVSPEPTSSTAPAAAPSPFAPSALPPPVQSPSPAAIPVAPSALPPAPIPPTQPPNENQGGIGLTAPVPHNKSANPPRREKLKTTAAVAGMGATPGFGSGGSGLPGAMTSFPATSQTAVGGYPVTSNRLAEAIMVEETQGDPNAAARAYESLMAGFDQQRSAAAQAIFRLAEVYRRSGRNEEARTLHGRILREFVDFPELAQSSLRILSFNAPPLSAAVPAPADPAPTAQRPFDAAAYRVESLRLMQRELARRKDLVSKGLVSESEIFPLERDILQLQQQIARDEDIATSPNFDHPPAAKPAAGR